MCPATPLCKKLFPARDIRFRRPSSSKGRAEDAGLTDCEIAERMFLAEKTVENSGSRLLTKLGMERRTQAALFTSKLRVRHTQ